MKKKYNLCKMLILLAFIAFLSFGIKYDAFADEPIYYSETIDSGRFEGTDVFWKIEDKYCMNDDIYGGAEPVKTYMNEYKITISGRGAIPDFEYEATPWSGLKYDGYTFVPDPDSEHELMYVKKVVIEEGITEIGDEAFGGCIHLNSVSIANGVERIGNGAFDFARELTSITLPSSLKTIGDNAFSNSGLTRMIVPDGVTSIGKFAFNGNENLVKLILPASITYMGDATDMGPMSGCPKLTSATDLGGGGAIEFGFTKIPDNSFAGCVDLETVSFPSGLTEIGDQAFKYCKKIKTLAFPAGTKVIGVDAFYSCTDLEKLIIPASVDTIKLNGEEYDGTTRAPFYKCEKLLTVGPAGDGNTYDITYGWTDIPAYAFFWVPADYISDI